RNRPSSPSSDIVGQPTTQRPPLRSPPPTAASAGPLTSLTASFRKIVSQGPEPVEKVLRESGIVPTEAGKARWREALRRPIPEEALSEDRRRLAEGGTR